MAAIGLPPLDSPRSISAEDRQAYDANGWTLIRGLCSPEEAAAHGAIISEVAFNHNQKTRPLEERDTYGKAFLQITNL